MMFMKKGIVGFIFILILIFSSMLIMILFDNRYVNDIENKIIKNTDIRDIVYVNEYDNNYIVMNNLYLYLFNDKYEEIYKVEIEDIYKNKNDYDIVYRDNTIMYMNSYKKKNGVIFKYYDIFTYELIDEVMVGGN